MRDYIASLGVFKEIIETRAGGVISSHCGPGTLGVLFIAKMCIRDRLNPEGKMCLYAPDVTVGPDGRYYLYYVLDKVSVVSVAVCRCV